jgi:hypothetical protein
MMIKMRAKMNKLLLVTSLALHNLLIPKMEHSKLFSTYVY